MQADRHQPIRQIIDKSLVGAATLQEEQTLRAHVVTCSACQEYLNTSHRAIAGLGGFSFEVNPELHQRVIASLTARARQLEIEGARSRPIWWNFLVAVMLTVAGSFAIVEFASLAAAFLHIELAPLHLGLIAFWIVPSLCFCLLLPFLSRLSAGWNEKGFSQ
jgi:hypothetical protein